jgi:hypothetical protein
MWFDVQAALAEIEGEAAPACKANPRATSATSATKPARVASVASVATPPTLEIEPETSPYGTGIAGGIRTWTGKIVSKAVWATLGNWDRHGSTGKVWNGLTKQWEASTWHNQ